MSEGNQQNHRRQFEKSKTTRHLAVWTITWLLATALLAFGPKFLWDYDPMLSWATVILNVGIGVAMVLANRNALRALDEMEQKIFLEASVLTLGVGLVFAGCFQLIGDIRLVSFEPMIAHVMIVMALTFLLGMLIGHRRYT
ncbi:MAG: hypothetical protein AB8F65_13595 [Woeseiaceae bacterium]